MPLKVPVRTRGTMWRRSMAVSLIASLGMIVVLVVVFAWRAIMLH